MIELLLKVPEYKLFRKLGRPRMLPFNLTVSVTYRCNSRCKTCKVYMRRSHDFTLEEFDRTFKSLGRTPFWITLSGGEPFLRQDIAEICRSVYDRCRPEIINIPTNGTLNGIVPKKTEEIVRACPQTKIVVNISIDEIGERHDELRNFKDNFKLAMDTYGKLRAFHFPNFILGIHTVISKYNIDNFPTICDYFCQMKPDSYITEIAEERVELGTVGLAITPSYEEYSKAIDILKEAIRKQSPKGLSRFTKAFRLQYYQMAKEVLKRKSQIIPCYAGFASAQISPDGDIWACCVKAEPMGNLRDVGYNFGKIWFGERAERIRETIKKGGCYCPLANVSYTNMLFNFKSLAKVAWGLL